MSNSSWNDILLQWNPEDFGGVDHVRVPASEIWLPDIVLYNYADQRLTEYREALAVVSHSGNVLWIPMAILKSTCSIDIRHFPFDIQECTLKFGSWTYDGFQVDLDFYDGLQEVDISDYVESNEWNLLDNPAIRHVKFYPCCEEPYIDLTFTLKLKRMGAFYSYILVLPCVLLSVLTLVVFWLPPESSAKMMMGMNIFVAFFLLLRILADSTPPASSSVPLIGAYFCLNMILIALSTFLSVSVINLYFRGDRKNKVPPWLRKLMVDGLARVFCMRSDYVKEESKKAHVKHTAIIETPSPRRKNSKEKRKIKSPVLKYNKWEPPNYNSADDSPLASRHYIPTPDRSPMHYNHALETEVKEVRKALRVFMHRLQEKDAAAKIALEWRIVALVLDRLFFYMYLAAIGVSLFTVFPKDH